MSGSAERGGQRRRQVEDEESGGADAVEASGSGLPPAQMKTPRRSVQTKLNFFVPLKGRGRGRGGGGKEGEGESSSSGEEGRRKPKRKKKAQPRTPTKVSAIGKEGIGFNSRSKKLLPTSDDGSDFFVKISEKRLKQKHQREQEDVVDLTVEDGTCSIEALQVIGKDYPLCSDPKGPKSKLRLRSGNASAAEDTVALDLNRCQPTMDTSSESKNTEV
ncbi:hypothetical protein Taro_018825, partial [Colocasia esculenta]|nr:hypothetical protein [Colocasia esculenta]